MAYLGYYPRGSPAVLINLKNEIIINESKLGIYLYIFCRVGMCFIEWEQYFVEWKMCFVDWVIIILISFIDYAVSILVTFQLCLCYVFMQQVLVISQTEPNISMLTLVTCKQEHTYSRNKFTVFGLNLY